MSSWPLTWHRRSKRSRPLPDRGLQRLLAAHLLAPRRSGVAAENGFRGTCGPVGPEQVNPKLLRFPTLELPRLGATLKAAFAPWSNPGSLDSRQCAVAVLSSANGSE